MSLSGGVGLKSKKDLNRNRSISYQKEANSDENMNRRGQIIEVGALLLIFLTTVGVAVTVSNSTTLFVGDKQTHHYFDYYKCKELAKNIPQDRLEVFASQQDAINRNYNATIGCV